MFRLINQVILSLLCCCVHSAHAQGIAPTLFEANYTIHAKGMKIAKMKRHLTRFNNGIYQYHSETRTAGLISFFRKDQITEISKWRLDADKIIPIYYFYDHSGGKKERTVNISFDWEKKRITNSIDDSSWEMPIVPKVMDKLLYQLAIMYDLEADKKPSHYIVADGGKTKNYNFEIIGEEIINTPLGNLETIKLVRLKPNSRRKSTLWCAKKLEFLPIKVENIENNGNISVALIDSLRGISY